MRRLVGVVFLMALALSGCSLGHLDNPLAPTPVELATPKRIVIIGDSFTAGSTAGGQGDNNWTKLAFNELAQDRRLVLNPLVAAEDGAGYVVDGEQGHRFLALAGPAILPSDDLIIVFGSSSDASAPIGLVQPAAHTTLGQIKSVSKAAKILVIGPAWVGLDPPPELFAVRDAVAAEAKFVGADFIDPLTEKWLQDDAVVGTDGTHPNDRGHEFLATQLVPLIRSELQESQTKVS